MPEVSRFMGGERKKLKKYSGGMKQRVSIAQALLNDPEIPILMSRRQGLTRMRG